MDLRITYGWHLDGPSYPHLKAVGDLKLGPVGFISQLALRLGLTGIFPAPAVRIGNYLAALKSIDNGEQFYSRSFQTDSWGTARALLQLRDELVSSGWSSDLGEGGGERLQTLARVERAANGLTSLTDLTNPILKTLSKRKRIPIREIRLVDQAKLLPPTWQRILKALAANSVNIEPLMFRARASSASDLSRVANNLLTKKAPSKLAGDGTFCVIEADDEVQAADFTANWLACGANEDDKLVFIRGSGTSFLDQLLRKIDLPALGNNVPSSQRGFLQLLPLALETSWSPVNPARVVELLTLPSSPIQPYAAQAFLRALRNQPGIGGADWHFAWTTVAERRRTSLLKRDDTLEESVVQQKVSESISNWRLWLEPPIFDTVDGMPAQQAMSVCKRVREHSLALYAVQGLDVFAKSASCADTLSMAIDAAGVEKIPKAQLDRMLESVMSDGYVADQPQAGPWTAIDHPGQICASVDTTFWWGFVSNIPQQRPSTWTDAELAFLREKHVVIEQPANKVAREAISWRRPTIASEKLILVKPRTVAGREIAAHPFFHEIAESIETAPNLMRPLIVRQSQNIYMRPEIHIAGRTLHRRRGKSIQLPVERPIWKITPGLSLGEKESPTSVERLLGCQLNWLLRHKARIRPGNLLTMAEGEQLAGNLAHAIFSTLFTQLPKEQWHYVGQKAEELFDDLCPKVAASLLLPGKSLERLKLRKAISEGAEHLAALVIKAGFEQITCETERQAKFDTIDFGGRPDMHLSHETENDFVIDLKWAQKTAYRRQELADGTAIQLAIYAWLCSQETGKPTAAGYYMLAQNQLLASASQPFPSHMHIRGATLDQTFQNIAESYLTHRAIVSSGTVYATGINDQLQTLRDDITGEETAVASQVVPGINFSVEPPCRFCDYKRICGKQGFDS